MLIELAGGGDVERFEAEVTDLGQNLLQVPPRVSVTRDEVVAALAMLLNADPVASEGIACCTTIAAWHVGDDELVKSAARQWYRALDAATAASDLRLDGPNLVERAASALQIGALCDVVFVAPESVATALEAAAAAARLTPAAELDAVQLLLDDATYCEAAGLPAERWHDHLRAAAYALAGVLAHGATRQPRAAIAKLVRAFGLLGDDGAAQAARLSLLPAVIVEGALDDADRLLADAAEGPVAAPEQAETLELARATVLFRRGQVAEAVRIAEAVAPRLAPWSWNRAHCASLRAEAAAVAGDYAAAVTLLRPVLDLLPAVPPGSVGTGVAMGQLAVPLDRLAFFALRAGDVALARDIAVRLAAAPGPHANRIAAALAVHDGHVDEGRARLQETITALESAAMQAEDQVGADPILGAVGVLAGDLALLECQSGDAGAALVACERARGWFFRGTRAARPAIGSPVGQLALLEKVQRSLDAAPERDSADPRRNAIDTFRRDFVAQTTALPIKALAGAMPIGPGDSDDDVAQVCGALPADWALVSVTVVEDRMVVVVTNGVEATCTAVRVGITSALRRAIALFTWIGGRGPEPRSERWRTAAGRVLGELEDALTRPILDGLGRVGRGGVLLSAPGPIASLPLAALRPAGGVPLADRLSALAVIPGLGAAADILRGRLDAPVLDEVVALAAPDARAPLTSVEARTVASSWRASGASVVLDAAADQVALFESAPRAKVLHVAAHGEWHPRAAARSRLLLHDGPVDLAEVYSGLALEGAELVVLSACQTATSSFAATGEAVNLALFALLAGAQRVSAGLWDVDDAASTLLMTDFHARLAAGGEAGASLLEAQRQLRTMPADGAVAALGRFEPFVDDDAEATALQRAKDRVVGMGDVPFESFHLWAPYTLHGLPGSIVPSGTVDDDVVGGRPA